MKQIIFHSQNPAKDFLPDKALLANLLPDRQTENHDDNNVWTSDSRKG